MSSGKNIIKYVLFNLNIKTKINLNILFYSKNK